MTLENSLELIDYVYQGPERYVRLTRKGETWKGALVNSLQIINSLFNVRFVATLNGHKILDETISRLEQPGYHYD